MELHQHKSDIETNGFTIINSIYTKDEINGLLSLIENIEALGETFRRSTDIFAIRQFLKEIPATIPLVFNKKLNQIIASIFGNDYFIVKSIYFDKPGTSNWFVAYHQDLTISVDKKAEIENFGPWTVKQNQYAVQPPVKILENIYTIRIHLDETTQDNGALKVIPRSHARQIYRPETINWQTESEAICEVEKGGIMIMKPLLLHSSGRTVNNSRRRVIHIEFSSAKLPEILKWSEKIDLYMN
ncbi:phytanoyl-CoA dioxygenase [Flavobacterium sp. Sd200]|uniref:phytanoyl-CoA dioxygenase family protein n=1 Tax=Flavobacterium sp. Sd200 TaxID=2692211 RepID=UPI00136D805D|nr:phytanoyl-CoA dioxygenase family protein [Flavobacterium sp. Sd200]MXN89891.1 phytanoyl-CoA dioxygenase [Flavobacterium sp. Sd200]